MLVTDLIFDYNQNVLFVKEVNWNCYYYNCYYRISSLFKLHIYCWRGYLLCYRVIPFGIRSQNHDHLHMTPDTAHHSQPPLQIHRHFDLFWKYVTWSLFPLRGIVYSIPLIYRYWSILFFLHEELLLLILVVYIFRLIFHLK